jgi:hypothetical protein
MAGGNEVKPEELGRRLVAALARPRELVRGIWITTRRGTVTIWILPQPLDPETQRRLYERTAVLYDFFPDAELAVHVLNPGWFKDGDALSALPPDAQPIPFTTTEGGDSGRKNVATP